MSQCGPASGPAMASVLSLGALSIQPDCLPAACLHLPITWSLVVAAAEPPFLSLSLPPPLPFPCPPEACDLAAAAFRESRQLSPLAHPPSDVTVSPATAHAPPHLRQLGSPPHTDTPYIPDYVFLARSGSSSNTSRVFLAAPPPK